MAISRDDIEEVARARKELDDVSDQCEKQVYETHDFDAAVVSMERVAKLSASVSNLTRSVEDTKVVSVCEVSGNFMSSKDNDERMRAHFEGKQYQGWRECRDRLKQLQAAASERTASTRGGTGGEGSSVQHATRSGSPGSQRRPEYQQASRDEADRDRRPRDRDRYTGRYDRERERERERDRDRDRDRDRVRERGRERDRESEKVREGERERERERERGWGKDRERGNPERDRALPRPRDKDWYSHPEKDQQRGKERDHRDNDRDWDRDRDNMGRDNRGRDPGRDRPDRYSRGGDKERRREKAHYRSAAQDPALWRKGEALLAEEGEI
jgi:hypothetical protein